MADEESHSWDDLRLTLKVVVVLTATFFFAQTVVWNHDSQCDQLVSQSCVPLINE